MSSHHLSSNRSALSVRPTSVAVSLALSIDADLACIAARSQSAQQPAHKLEMTVPMAERRAQDFKNLADENFVSRRGYLEQERTKAKTHGRQTQLTAPVEGTIKQLAVRTVGGVVTPAQQLMVIVPKGDTLKVEAFIENKDIGFVRPGQTAVVKQGDCIKYFLTEASEVWV